MKKVYIVNDGGHDYEKAERFGDITFCVRKGISRWDISRMYIEIHAALQDAEPTDYLLISSLTSMFSVAVAIMAYRFGEVHFLIYKDGDYIERDLILYNEDE